jgi:hypothetical protein
LPAKTTVRTRNSAAHRIWKPREHCSRLHDGALFNSLLGAISGALMHADAWARADKQTEYPSLFSPYWQAALAPVSIGERSTAMAAQIPTGNQAGKP